MTTETQSNDEAAQKSAENKAVFGPLGKYAVVAVIMVSIIVTTAIMLDKQLNRAENQIAAFESEIAELHKADIEDDTLAAVDVRQAPVEGITAENTTSSADTVTEAALTDKVAETEVAVATESTTSAQVKTTVEITAQPVVATTEIDAAAVQATTQLSANEVSSTTQTQNAAAYQARVEGFKIEQKQRIAEMFARIKALEAQQLDRYKANQDDQIGRLREQIAKQQAMIESLVLRNENLFELRSANIQRNQDNREQLLNRI